MKQDKLLEGILSFLVPIIFLYGCYNLADLFLGNGFLSLFLSLILFVCAIVLHSLNSDGFKRNIKNRVKILEIAAIAGFLCYFCSILLVVTDWFSI
jgi:hypothetical protein